MAHTYKDYDGFLIIKKPSKKKTKELINFIEALNFPAKLSGNSIEIEWSSRDFTRSFVKKLLKLAEIIGDADGEVTCTLSTDKRDPIFEFYSIKNHQLTREIGSIKRGPCKSITNESEI